MKSLLMNGTVPTAPTLPGDYANDKLMGTPLLTLFPRREKSDARLYDKGIVVGLG